MPIALNTPPYFYRSSLDSMTVAPDGLLYALRYWINVGTLTTSGQIIVHLAVNRAELSGGFGFRFGLDDGGRNPFAAIHMCTSRLLQEKFFKNLQLHHLFFYSVNEALTRVFN